MDLYDLMEQAKDDAASLAERGQRLRDELKDVEEELEEALDLAMETKQSYEDSVDY